MSETAGLIVCRFEGGTGCPGSDGGPHYFAHIDPDYEGRSCIDCGDREAVSVPKGENQ